MLGLSRRSESFIAKQSKFINPWSSGISSSIKWSDKVRISSVKMNFFFYFFLFSPNMRFLGQDSYLSRVLSVLAAKEKGTNVSSELLCRHKLRSGQILKD